MLLSLFAVTAPGLEAITAAELGGLGIVVDGVERGGVTFRGDAAALQRAHLWLRTASRILVRVGEELHATAFHELERRARRLPWGELLAPGRAVVVKASSHGSRLYHTGAIAERIAGVLAEAVAARPVEDREGEDEDDAADDDGVQLVMARMVRDRCALSLDATGPLLHRRGYRRASAKAPLRETLAAALLLGAGWDPARPLLDPMCGAGTIAIEAALLARHLAPGRRRRFRFMDWPSHDATIWRRLEAEADAAALERAPAPLCAADRDAGAIVATRANAERAGVGGDVETAVRPVDELVPPDGRGWIASNPPYGVRVPIGPLHRQLGDVLRRRCAGWTVALLTAAPDAARQLRLPLVERLRTRNGGIQVRLLVGDVPGG